MARFFQIAERGSTVGREIAAGLTTFAAMAYILAVNPDILAAAGMDRGALVTVTAISAALATALMAVLTNYPIALAPGRGINAFFAFTVCLGFKVPWQEALGMVFINGILFLLLSLSGVREKLVNAIPLALKSAIACGIGLFIAFLGLKNGGIVVANPATFVNHGDFSSPVVALAIGGIALTFLLVAWRVPGAIVIGMAAVTLAGLFVPGGTGGMVTARPAALFSAPHSPAPVLLHLRFDFLRSWNDFHRALPIILTLLLVDMFDNIGTLIGVAKSGGFLAPDGRLPKAGRALLADSVATLLSALLGTSTVVSYIESAAGVESGGRTGLSTLCTAAFMLLALLLTPLILAVPPVATAPALIVVGILMMKSVRDIGMDDFATAAPAILTLLAIPLTFSIAAGIGLGLIFAVVIALGMGRARSLSPLVHVFALIFLLEFFGIFPFGR